MRIELRISGGVAGVRRTHIVDTARLGEPDASELEALAATVELPSRAPAPRGPDRRQYDLVLESEQGRRAGTLREGAMDDAARALVARVRELGRPG
ncbi:MAG: Emfourin [Solirubrobacteraceae bacterium]|nr:Emfourin [Solirubrobacteraceae bacterium]